MISYLPMPIPDRLLRAAAEMRNAVEPLSFGAPVTHVYNPLRYAWDGHRRFIKRFATGRRRVVFVGMNPGPWGMVQTGVPFGEVAAVRDWLGIEARVGKPAVEHPRRPIAGFACSRSEVSGRRLWGLFRDRFGTPSKFFRGHYIANYCPLVFMERSGRNRTPDKLPAAEREPLYEICDRHLVRVAGVLEPRWVVAIGAFAEQRAAESLADAGVRIARILHPSPASPAANKNWAVKVARQLEQLGVWRK